jgi:hypothetical protein
MPVLTAAMTSPPAPPQWVDNATADRDDHCNQTDDLYQTNNETQCDSPWEE